MNLLADRFKLARESLGLEQKEIAAKLDISHRSWQDYELGKSVPGGKVFESLVLLGFNANWLLSGEGPMKRGEGSELPGGFVQVPRYAIAAAAGGGALVHSEQIVDHIAFKADWLKQQLGLSPAQAAVISVIGDSMEPCLADGDLILIDTSVTRVENNAIYVIQVEGDLLVKRIQKKIDGTVIIKSDNERYEPEIFRGESVELLKVVGRMVRRLVR